MRWFAFVCVLVVPAVAFSFSKGLKEVDRASEMMVRGDYARAEPILRRATADRPNDPYAHFDLASVLRATGRNDDAIAEYHVAKHLFETVGPRANGPADIGNCLYGIALAQEAKDDPTAAIAAWNEYLRFAQSAPSERAAVAIAHEHVDLNRRVAQGRAPYPGTQKASRPATVR